MYQHQSSDFGLNSFSLIEIVFIFCFYVMFCGYVIKNVL